MSKAKQQPDHDQISAADASEPDVVAYEMPGSSEAAIGENCKQGFHWDPDQNKCVPD
jgi:hypothetical protein